MARMRKNLNNFLGEEIASLLLRIHAVTIDFKNPITFSSGVVSPVFIDNRLIISYPKIREIILNHFLKIIEEKIGLRNIDTISGTATAAIPHAALIAERLNKPMIYVRSKEKAHGKENKIEGVLKKRQKVIVIEDHISSGGSAMNNVLTLRDAGAIVNDCLAISTYNLKIANNLFKQHKVNLYTLTNFQTILKVAVAEKYLNKREEKKLMDWYENPITWGFT